MKTSSTGAFHGRQTVTGWTPDACSRLVEAGGDTLRPGGLELTEYLLGFGDFHDGSRILDAGCGMGATLQYLHATRSVAAVGVDSSAAMLAAARRHTPESSLVCAALEKLPFGEASFDGVICECVLSQTSARAVLAEFQRVLASDGLLLLTDLYRRGDRPHHSGEQTPGTRLATKEQIETMLEEAGFIIEQWQDRTRDLQNLAIRLIMAPGDAAENLSGWSGTECIVNEEERRSMGYYLLTARSTAR